MTPSKPKPDPEVERRLAEERKRAEDERKALEAQQAEEEDARQRGLRGARALLAGPYSGFGGSSLLG